MLHFDSVPDVTHFFGKTLTPECAMINEKAKEIKELVESFGKQHFDKELSGCAVRLCDKLSSISKLDITRGKKEIWAASIVYVIARVNFLFDKENSHFLSSDSICDFFGTKKTTTGNKATAIEKTLIIGIGDENYCTSEIMESFSFVELPGGIIVPQKMANEMARKIVTGIASEEDSRQEGEAEQARIARRAEINRKAEEKKRKRKEEEQALINKRQLKLW